MSFECCRIRLILKFPRGNSRRIPNLSCPKPPDLNRTRPIDRFDVPELNSIEFRINQLAEAKPNARDRLVVDNPFVIHAPNRETPCWCSPSPVLSSFIRLRG